MADQFHTVVLLFPYYAHLHLPIIAHCTSTELTTQSRILPITNATRTTGDYYDCDANARAFHISYSNTALGVILVYNHDDFQMSPRDRKYFMQQGEHYHLRHLERVGWLRKHV